RASLWAATRDAGLTAVITFFLLLPLVGFETVQNIRNEIELDTRWPLLFTLVAVAAVGRLLYVLATAVWQWRRAGEQIAAAAPALGALLRRALGLAVIAAIALGDLVLDIDARLRLPLISLAIALVPWLVYPLPPPP